MEECEICSDQERLEESFWEPKKREKGLRIEEQKYDDYECPEIILSSEEEHHISLPWKKGVNFKMLGRHIGFKALENRLQQLWARKSIVNLVDLGQ